MKRIIHEHRGGIGWGLTALAVAAVFICCGPPLVIGILYAVGMIALHNRPETQNRPPTPRIMETEGGKP